MFTDGIYKIYSDSEPSSILGSLTISNEGHNVLAKLAANQTWPITLPDEQRLVFECVESAPDGDFPLEGSAGSEWVPWEGGPAKEETGDGGEMVEKYLDENWSTHGYGFVEGKKTQSRHYGFKPEADYPLPAIIGTKYGITRDAEIGSVGALQTRLKAIWGEDWSGYAITEEYE